MPLYKSSLTDFPYFSQFFHYAASVAGWLWPPKAKGRRLRLATQVISEPFEGLMKKWLKFLCSILWGISSTMNVIFPFFSKVKDLTKKTSLMDKHSFPQVGKRRITHQP